MKDIRWIAVACVGIILVYITAHASEPQPPRPVVCATITGFGAEAYARKIEEWATERQSEGYTDFWGQQSVVCAYESR